MAFDGWILGAVQVGVLFALQGPLDYDLRTMVRALAEGATLKVAIPDGAWSAYFIALAVAIVWLIVFDAFGGTPAKRILRLRITRAGEPRHLGLGRSTLRWIGRIAASALCYVGYIVACFDPERRGWHDRIAGSRVVLE